jgi:pimeloyl-ACP methyl ester carboxylesterase
VTTPTLVVWGRHDRIVPLDCGEQYRDLLADAELEIVEDAGHAVDLEQPDTLARLIVEFVASRDRGPSGPPSGLDQRASGPPAGKG